MEPRVMSKEEIADWAGRIAQVAYDTALTLPEKNSDYKVQFFMKLMLRQQSLLNDMKLLLENRSAKETQSAFILARCLLDDFIIVLHFLSKGFDKEEVVKHTANAYKKLLQMAKDGDEINNKYFEGKLEVFSRSSFGISQWESFESNTSNDQFYEDLSTRKFKFFDSTSELVRKFPINAESAANVGALTLWQYYSRFVHFSILTRPTAKLEESRIKEIAQLRFVMLYSFKTIYFCSLALNQYGFTNQIVDSTNVIAELIEGSVELNDIDIKSVPSTQPNKRKKN